MGNLFDLSINEDYYKPIITNDAFNSNYIQYESKRDEDKISSIKEYLNFIRPSLDEKINDHKTYREWKIHSDNKVMIIKLKGDGKFNYQ